VCGGVAGHSAAPKGESVGARGNKAKVYESKGTPNYIVTLYMTSSRYNNTAVIYCTGQVEHMADKAGRRPRPQTSVLPPVVLKKICFFFTSFHTLCHLCFCS